VTVRKGNLDSFFKEEVLRQNGMLEIRYYDFGDLTGGVKIFKNRATILMRWLVVGGDFAIGVKEGRVGKTNSLSSGAI